MTLLLYNEEVKYLLALLLLVVVCLQAADQSSAAAVARALQEAGLDPEQCYRVRDLAFQKDEAKFYLTEGHLIFARPVEGRRFAAVFTADGPGGDGEVLLMPPHRSERQSMAAFTQSPNLDEHFSSALFLFTDGTGEELLGQITSAASVRKEPEAGLLLQRTYDSVLRNITSSYEIRLVRDLLSASAEQQGFLYAVISGKQLGTTDIIYDPKAREQILVGQIASRNQRQFFDVWTSFVARSFRNGRRKYQPEELNIADINIVATVEPNLHLRAVTKLMVAPRRATERVISLDLSRRMNITSAKLDGAPVEVFTRDSLRASLVRGGENDVCLIVMPTGLQPGRTYTLELLHDGDVVSKSGSGVYYVGSRGSWYPNGTGGFSKYDLTFRYPKNLSLVATGDVVEDKTEGDWRVTRRTISSPIRFAGFNLGEYEKTTVTRAGYAIEVYANRALEDALRPKQHDVLVLPPTRGGLRRPGDILPSPTLSLPPNPLGRLQHLANEIASAMEFMASNFGPPPLKKLTVSPIPGTFGQGFPGLLYLSTLAYLNPSDRPVRTETQQTFYSEVLHAHETAHQWWGNLVMSLSYQDDWLMESLANYSALLLLERKKGRRALEAVLDEYRDHLLTKTEQGKTVESAGPIVWGPRLVSSQSPASWRIITYEKGTWIIHMLRVRLGDERFLKMSGELARRKAYGVVTTDDLRQIASEFLPPKSEDPKLEAYFEQWVYGTGMPTLKLNYAVSGKAPNLKVRGTIVQSDVDEDFSTLVPIELQLPGKRSVTKWVRTSGEPAPFSIDLKVAPVKVQLDPARAVLARH